MLTSFNLTFFVGICRRCAELLVLHEHVPSEIHESNHDTQDLLNVTNSATFIDEPQLEDGWNQDEVEDSEVGNSQTLSTVTQLSQGSNWSEEDRSEVPLDDVNHALSLLSRGAVSPLKHKTRSNLAELHPSSIRALKRKATSAVLALLDSIAPGQGTELLQLIHVPPQDLTLSPPSYPDLVGTIIKLYNNTVDSNVKKQLLSILAKDFSKKDLQEMIPGLTVYSVDQARIHASVFGEGAQVPTSTKRFRQRLDQDKLAHALEFFFNPLFYQVSSHGMKEMKLENGERVAIPEVVRTVCHSNLIHMYESFCKDSNYTNPLSSSSLYEILRACPASKRTSLRGLDNIATDGAAAFDTLNQVIQKLQSYVTSPDVQTSFKNLQKDLTAYKLYLKGDYRLGLSNTSSCPDHCIAFALSDRSNSNLQTLCSHKHDGECPRCKVFDNCLTYLKESVHTAEDVPSDVQCELLNDIDVAGQFVLSWKQHLVRCVNQDYGRTSVLRNLQSDEVLIIMDWAMKFLPISFREKQSEWFGQKGINWHISVCIFRGDDNLLKHRTYVHLFDFVKQDWFAVASVLEHTLTTIKEQMPGIQKVFLRSDNAGCYHCGNLWLSLHGISNRTGLSILRYDFSESQDGKSYCDAKIAHLRGKIRQYVSGGNNVRTAQDMKDAIDSMKGVVGCQAVLVQINSKSADEASAMKTVWKGITKISNIELRNQDIVAWKAYGIGDGEVLPKEKLTSMCPFPLKSTDIVTLSDFATPTRGEGKIHYQHQACQNQATAEQIDTEFAESTETPHSSTAVFSCTETGCIKIFRTFSGLEQHLLCGTHKYLSARSSYDTIKLQWKETCERIAELPAVPSANTGTSATIEGESSCNMGWALKRERKNCRFDSEVRHYLQEVFELGEQTGKKVSAHDVSRNMRVVRDEKGVKRFQPDQYLQPCQISSFFSRLSVLARTTKKEVINDDDLESVLAMIAANEALDSVNIQF